MELQVLLLASILSLVFKVSCVVVSDSDNIEYSEGPTMAKRQNPKQEEIAAKFKEIEYVQTPCDGTFRYLMLEVLPPKLKRPTKLIIRGYDDRDIRTADFYKNVSAELKLLGLACHCEGGGYMKLDPEKKVIEVFGSTWTFGMADHGHAVKVLRKKYGKEFSIYKDFDAGRTE